jgi:hypothetical protein
VIDSVGPPGAEFARNADCELSLLAWVRWLREYISKAASAFVRAVARQFDVTVNSTTG